MKIKNQIISILILLIILLATFTAIGQNCVECTDNDASGSKSTALGFNSSAMGYCSFSAGFENLSDADYSFSMGHNSSAEGMHAFALGRYCRSLGGSYSFGDHAICNTEAAMALGIYVVSNASGAITIGKSDNEHPLTNTINNSLMVGFMSSYPTFYVGETPPGQQFGKIGIGTTDPKSTLHVNGGVISEEAMGIGTDEPSEKLHVKGGNIYLEDIDAGVVMRSPDGNCWKITVGNDGQLNTEAYNCYTDIPESPGTDDLSVIKAYPNPSKGELVVELNQTDLQNLNLQILDASGKLVSSKAINRSTNNIDISSLKSGLYLIRVYDQEEEILYKHKFIKE
ncbi:MAG: T9SS type A sorting domain-containing protein [Bacteroidales bacterium]|nr:T9SS type A sorting domain-containing protein [Bacteroidales bacterium]MCF8388572.1 T9SS type A sorting domain-containing protein [Bacteroidales bacterium]MCF8397298.1 T9SS type A sorting domain-containing protein [Bacteroidales bacterium]